MKAIDPLESLLIMALESDHPSIKQVGGTIKTREGSKTEHDVSEVISFNDATPRSAYTLDISDDGRLFSSAVDYMKDHPIDILGNRSESIWMHPSNDLARWNCVERLQKKPKELAYLGKASAIYAYHYRVTLRNGAGQYFKRYVVLNKSGSSLPVKVSGQHQSAVNDGEDVLLMASIIEDAHRTGAMLASIKDAIEIKFPVPLADYKKVFIERDAPLVNGKRKAIIHWVASHMRKSKAGTESQVKRHVRGVKDIVIDGLKINIEPNA